MSSDCVFCQIIAGTAPAKLVWAWPDAIAFVPLDPVTEGHVLVVPRAHVADATVDPVVTACVFARAAQMATPPCNLITSAGTAATQTVRHLHAHIVPRCADDGLTLPWTKKEA